MVSDIPAVAWGVGLLLMPLPEPWGPWVRAWVGLALVATPAVARRALDALSAVPGDELVTAVALGASRGEAIAWVGLPRAARGLLRATVAGIGRATGETVVLLLVLEPAGVYTLGQAVVLSALEPDLVSPALGVASAGLLLLVGVAVYAIGRVGREP
jgi:phosphate transport system permease protein